MSIYKHKGRGNGRIQIRTVPSWLTIPESVLRALKGLHFTRTLQVASEKLAMIRSQNVQHVLCFSAANQEIVLINSELRLIGLRPLVRSAAVTAVNAAALTPARTVSGETSTSLLATPLVLTLRWRRLSRSLLRGKGGCTCDNGLRAGRLQV